MEHTPHSHPIFGLFLTITLFLSSVFMGILENADLILSVVSKLVATGAGIASIVLAYFNYLKLKRDNSNSKGT